MENNQKIVLCELAETPYDHVESYSPFCIKVRRALAVTGLPYESERRQAPGRYKDLNPTGQVPVLKVGDEVICDSTRIVQRIEELSASPMSAGLDARQSAQALLWEELADTALNGFVVAARWADERNWPKARAAFFLGAPKIVCAIVSPQVRRGVLKSLRHRDVTRAGMDACWKRYAAMLDQMEMLAPESGFWITDRITVADVAIFGQLESLRIDLTQWQWEQIEARPRLRRYLDRVDHATRFAPRARRRTPQKLRAAHAAA